MNQNLITILIAAFACSALAAEFHIASTGNDANPGTAAKPFATLQKARDAVRSDRHTHDQQQLHDQQRKQLRNRLRLPGT